MTVSQDGKEVLVGFDILKAFVDVIIKTFV